MKGFFENEQYDSVVIAGQRMADQIQKLTDEINAMPVSGLKEGENFKTASVRYFDFMKNVYISYKKTGLAKTDAERQKEFTDLMQQLNDKTKIINEMQSAQRKFAGANGFKVR